MARKEVISCDDCGKTIDGNKSTIYCTYELCDQCVLGRMIHSLASLKPENRFTKCKNCGGKGWKKDFYGYHNDWDRINCGVCFGKGKIDNLGKEEPCK